METISHYKIPKPHDSFFKQAMEIPQVALEFFQSYLPESILTILDLTTLKSEPDSFIDPTLSAGQVDVLFSVKCHSQESYIYILSECQIKPRPLHGFPYGKIYA